MKVFARDGKEWIVRRRLLTPRLSFRSIVNKVERTGAGDLTADYYTMQQGVRREAGATLAFVLIVAAIAERVVLLVTAPFTLTARLVHLIPWVVEARPRRGARPHTWDVVGWRDSHRLLRSIADDLERGRRLPSVNSVNG